MHLDKTMADQTSLELDELVMEEETEEMKERNQRVEMERLCRLYTKEEMDEFSEAFSLFDRDGNGNITAMEMGMVMRALGQCPTQSDIYEMIGKIDRNRNGMIDFPEFMILMSQKKKSAFRDNPEYIRKCFQIFDTDNDGFISSEELRHIMMNLGEKLSNAEVDEMIKVADIDGDGRLNYNEFIVMMYPD